MKRIDFIRHLKNNNCYLVREGNNHSIWANADNDKQSAVPRHNELSNMLCKTICKQLNISAPKSF